MKSIQTKGFHTVYILLNLKEMTSFEYMFAFIREMTSIHFSSLFNTENITDMASMFCAAKSLTSIDVSILNTE